jgi:hypothetical protein
VVGKEELLGLRKREDPTSSIMCMNVKHYKPQNDS